MRTLAFTLIICKRRTVPPAQKTQKCTIRFTLSCTDAQYLWVRCRSLEPSLQQASALTGYHSQRRDIHLSVRRMEKNWARRTCSMWWKSGRMLKALRAVSCYLNLLTWFVDEKMNVNDALCARGSAAIALSASNLWGVNVPLKCSPGCLLNDAFSLWWDVSLMDILAA